MFYFFRKKPRRKARKSVSTLAKEKINRKKYLDNKERARELILQRLEHFNSFYNFKYNIVAVRDQKTRWGSCSSKGNLNFNYKILFLDSDLADYIIVHELCHLKEMNHGANFWQQVELQCPDYKSKMYRLRLIRL